MSEAAVLIGGPHDGRQITGTRAKIVETVFSIPSIIITGTPRPPWWHPVRRRRWKPPPPPVPPKFIQLRYEADGTVDSGRRVFRLASPWQPYRGPDANPADNGNLYKALVIAVSAVHPRIRQDLAIRWVMNLNWYNRVRRELSFMHYANDDDPETWKPSPKDTLMGIKVTVTDDGGAPHLENPRYPEGWPK